MESWRAKLGSGDAQGAWDDFITRYRRLILATIRRTLGDNDDVADVFAEVCASLSANDLERLRRHIESGTARFSTWLVTVVHHQTIDWVRHREGRPRVRPPAGLSLIQQEIFQRVVDERHPHVEAYEVIRQKEGPHLTFGRFLKELAETYRLIEHARGKAATRYFAGPPVVGDPEKTIDEAMIAAETGNRLVAAMEILPPDERLAIQLFVVEELAADRVARAVGWPNAKAVYNRVYRGLALLRKELESRGMKRSDD